MNSREYARPQRAAQVDDVARARTVLVSRSTKNGKCHGCNGIRRSHHRLRRVRRNGRLHAHQKGVKCLMLDAGPQVDFQRNRGMKAVYELPYRGFGKPGRLPHVFQANEFNANQWVDEEQVPYTHDPKEPYNWVRVRMVGGKSMFWARMSFRLSDYEFKAKDHDGFGDNWPISHADLAPFYSTRRADLPRIGPQGRSRSSFPTAISSKTNHRIAWLSKRLGGSGQAATA